MLNITIEYHSGIPVYKQMTDALISAIRSGELQEGDKLPPIRKLSEELNINPNTTAKVYRELELKGFIESRTGSGCFVLPHAKPELSPIEKEEKLSGLFGKLIREAKAFQINEQELMHYLQRRVG